MITLLMIALVSGGFVVAFAFALAGLFLFGTGKSTGDLLAAGGCLFCSVFTVLSTVAVLDWLT